MGVPEILLNSDRQYDELTSKHIDQLRQLTKQIQDARMARDNDAIKTSLEVGQNFCLGTCRHGGQGILHVIPYSALIPPPECVPPALPFQPGSIILLFYPRGGKQFFRKIAPLPGGFRCFTPPGVHHPKKRSPLQEENHRRLRYYMRPIRGSEGHV